MAAVDEDTPAPARRSACPAPSAGRCSRTARRRAEPPRAGARRPRTTSSPISRAELARVRGQHLAARASRPARAPRAHLRRRRRAAPPRRARGGRRPSSLRCDRARARPPPHPPSPRARVTSGGIRRQQPVGVGGQRPLDGLQHPALEDRQRPARARRASRSPRPRGGAANAERHGAPDIPGSRRRRRRAPDVYLLPVGLRRGTSSRIDRFDAAFSVSAGSSPMSATSR